MRTTEPMQLDIYVNVHIHRIPLGSTPLLIRGMATGGGDRRQEPHIHHLSRCPGRPSPSVQAPGCSQGWQPGHNQDSGVCTSQQTTPRSRLRPWTSLPKTTWDPSSLLGRRYLPPRQKMLVWDLLPSEPSHTQCLHAAAMLQAQLPCRRRDKYHGRGERQGTEANPAPRSRAGPALLLFQQE